MSNILPAENTIQNKTIRFFNNVDIGIDLVLEKTETVINKVGTFFNSLFDFIKNALKKKNLKKVYYNIYVICYGSFNFWT
jgi:hypothetical protein